MRSLSIKRGRKRSVVGSGRMLYVPKPVLDRLFEIKRRRGLKRNCDAWDRLLV